MVSVGEIIYTLRLTGYKLSNENIDIVQKEHLDTNLPLKNVIRIVGYKLEKEKSED